MNINPNTKKSTSEMIAIAVIQAFAICPSNKEAITKRLNSKTK